MFIQDEKFFQTHFTRLKCGGAQHKKKPPHSSWSNLRDGLMVAPEMAHFTSSYTPHNILACDSSNSITAIRSLALISREIILSFVAHTFAKCHKKCERRKQRT